MRMLLAKQYVASCCSLFFLLQEKRNFSSFLLTQAYVTGSREKKLQKTLYHLAGGLATACSPGERGERGVLGLGILICMHSWKSSSLAASCFSNTRISLNLYPFDMHSSWSLLTFMRLVQCVIPKSNVPSFNFNSATFIALKIVICGDILEDCSCLAQQQVSCFCWLCRQTFWFFCQLCID